MASTKKAQQWRGWISVHRRNGQGGLEVPALGTSKVYEFETAADDVDMAEQMLRELWARDGSAVNSEKPIDTAQSLTTYPNLERKD